ncbi:hypothetical protein TVAG_071760 [Trichomonas vaginalis G3]|uniref:CUB domain-containing protein n=1 Tax=Trichomonas vaginalis (strain ATCC PRA-98 / G3) TaxID=412133 RepID=A2D879_TRIV3|nr:hypothetical protein TVAGG3_1046870 [Trichomonas vaginalis G3]EAY23512.1 hypothetical protein TVAG_071760 [Trichomonas vaginalis G3]KAI5493934.1 hypothetical protein TVAGG3_1046870 [Trichomonas vaginalis G3]|eukprot:XP_001584498.1 hypothetical protein [Trichomonas vaginalis G3]
MLFIIFSLCRSATDSQEINSSCPVSVDKCTFVTTTNESIAEDTPIGIPFNTTCTLYLTECKTYGCYTIFDLTQFLKWGYSSDISYSFFREVKLSAEYNLTDSGIVFRPTTENFWLNFTTKTADEFFTIHPYESKEDPSASYNISQIVDGMPFCSKF